MFAFGKNFSKNVSNHHRKNLHLYEKLLGKVSFNLSDIGEGIREVIVKEWFVKEGDKVQQFDNICEVQSDKASVTITSRYDGVISKLHYKIDDTAFVGKPLIDIETDSEGEVKEEKFTEAALPVVENVQEAAPSGSNPEMLCTPSVRRLVKEHNIDVNKVRATGRNGRILKEDVLKFLEESNESREAEPASIGNLAKPLEAEPIRGFKRAMIKTMTDALKIPHFVYGDDIKFTEITKFRKLLNDKHDKKLSPLPFVIKAISNSLKKYPIINASIDENVENILYHPHHNIGIAMDTPAGLAVPVLRNVENLSIMEISSEIQRYLKSGKEGKFSPNDLTGGTFTLSNIGSIGGTHLKPVILPPQVAIMALGRSQILPRFDENRNVAAEEIAVVSASADHRVIDGATMARFVKDVKKQLESPYLLFMNI